VKLDTNGTTPDILKDLIDKKLLDYIAMDIKTHLDGYDKTAKVKVNKTAIKKSVELIKNSQVAYEFRTTVVPGYFDKTELMKICTWLEGSKKYVLQQFRNNTAMIDMTLAKTRPYPEEKLIEFKDIASKYFSVCEVRGI